MLELLQVQLHIQYSYVGTSFLDLGDPGFYGVIKSNYLFLIVSSYHDF